MQEFISAGEAGAKWNITVRRIQQLCSEGRIPGAVRLGRSWLIPANSAKPDDPRRARRTGSVFLPYAPMSCSIVFMPGTAEATLASLPDDEQRAQFESELQYLRGDFKGAKASITQTRQNSPTRICALLIGSAAAISDGDFALLSQSHEQLARLHTAFSMNPEATALIDLARASIAASILDAHALPEWLIRGDFSLLPPPARPMALYVYTKYLHRLGMYERMLGAAQAAIAMRNTERYSALDIYLSLMHAAACIGVGDMELAHESVLHAMRIALPDGYITPFAELYAMLCGLVEKCANEEFPEYAEPIKAQFERTTFNWIHVHNETAKEDVTLILTLAEYRVAMCAKDGCTISETARRIDTSVAEAKRLLNSVYKKLGITRKSELKQYIM